MATNNEIKKEEIFGELQQALPFVKLFIAHRSGEFKESGKKYNYIEVAELNRWGGGEIVKLDIPEELNSEVDKLRLGDVVRCYIIFEGLYKGAGMECINIEKLVDSNLPMPKTLSK